MNVKELINELSSCPGDFEIGYELDKNSINLLIGEDPDDKNSSAVTIPKPDWC